MPPSESYRPPGALVSHLSEFCGLRKNRQVEHTQGLEIHHLDLSPLRIKAPVFVPFVIPTTLAAHEKIDSAGLGSVLDAILDHATSSNHEWSAVLIGGDLTPDCEDMLRELSTYKVAVLDRRAADSIVNAKNKNEKQRALVTAISKSIGPTTLSPYVVGNLAVGPHFFGRAQVLNRILNGKNYTIIGTRRIGKTSLMNEVRRQLKRRHKKLIDIDVYASINTGTTDVLAAILRSLFERTTEVDRLVADPSLPARFPSLLKSIAQERDIRIAVFIDEMDRLLEADAKRGYETTNILRETFQQHDPLLRIFIAGFRRVREAEIKNDTPLFNFTMPEFLHAFTLEETTEMVEAPLSLLGIVINDPEFASIVYTETGGLPELIQICCNHVIDSYERCGEVLSSNDLMSRVFHTTLFQQKIWSTFSANTNDFEELLCYLLIQDAVVAGKQLETFEFGMKEADKLYNSCGIHLRTAELREVIENLSIAGIVSMPAPNSPRRRFAVPQLGRYIYEHDIEASVENAKSRCLTLGTNALWVEK
jgi:hypothetical protein